MTGHDETLKKLSILQRRYEWYADHERYSKEAELAAAQLSYAVGRMLVDAGYEATL